MPKNILILSNCSIGTYRFRGDLIRSLLQNNNVFVSCPDNGRVSQLRELGCQVIVTDIDRRGINPVSDFGLMRQYRRIIKQVKPDLVITYTIKPNIYGGILCRAMKIPYAANITGLGSALQKKGFLRGMLISMYTRALKKARVVFFENVGNREFFLDEGIIPMERTCVLSGAGVNLQHFTYAPYPKDETVGFLFIGRVMKEKGVDELFTAMRRLRADGYDCRLDVLGYYEDNYADVIRQCEADGWLRFHGFQDDVRPFIEKAHCFVLPSYHEGMANTNLECAAMGRPVITSDIPGCREAVAMELSGLLCRPEDADSLYETMKRFLSLPVEIRERMGKMGRQHMEATFDKNRVVDRTIRALEI